VPPLAYGAIGDELNFLYEHMVTKILGVLAVFLSFLEAFTIAIAHYMLALILDTRFKGFKPVIDFLGHHKVKLLA
jgi:hypothetical protein